jgi:hypothetical protein
VVDVRRDLVAALDRGVDLHAAVALDDSHG